MLGAVCDHVVAGLLYPTRAIDGNTNGCGLNYKHGLIPLLCLDVAKYLRQGYIVKCSYHFYYNCGN